MATERRGQPRVGDRGGPRGGLRRDQRGLSTVEYVIILLAVGLVGIAAWRGFGSSTSTRTSEASGHVGSLDEPTAPTQPGAGSGGPEHRQAGRTQLDEATGDAAPPPEASEQFVGPVLLLGAATLLVLGLVARRMLRKEKKKS